MGTELNERGWLSWLVKVRIIIITFLLGIELAVVQLTKTNVPTGLFLTLIAGWYATAVLFMMLQAFWRETRRQSVLQILTDLAFATGVIYASGGIDTYFNFLYPLVIIMASILLPRYWAYLTASLSFILFGALLELSYFEVIRSYSVSKPDLKSLQAVIFINLFAYLAVAYLASSLTAKLRQVDVQLQTKGAELEEMQALHENIINSMRGGLITTTLDGRITLLNAPGQRLLGRTARDVYGKNVAELFEDELPQVDSGAQGEIRAITPEGEQKILGMTVTQLQIPERGTQGYVYTFADLTDIRRLEREVRMRDRLAAVGRMAAGIAHEIRNPLASIAGSAHMLSAMTELSQEQQTMMGIISRESDRLNKIISDFLIYSREKSYNFTQCDLVALLEDTLGLLENRPYEENARVHVVRKYAVQEAPAVVDGDKIKQVFWNLGENAVKAMASGGTLTVSLRPALHGRGWQVAFSDNGPGIPAQQLDKIFEPFQSSFQGGTGLGLAIVYQITQAHNAKIVARSAPGRGAEFVLELMRGEVKTVQPEQSVAAQAGGGRG